MDTKTCIFCSITNKQTPAKIVYEDENSVAFLDINPRSTGMTIVSPKQHYNSFDENVDLSTKVFQSAEIVAEMIKQSLNPANIDFSIIPSKEVPHFHIRVYPVYENEIPLVENQPKKVTEEELNETARKIKSVKIELAKNEEPAEVFEEEEIEEPKRSKEDIKAIKREMELT